MGSLRLRLVQAGYRRDEALTIFFGIRVMFALGAVHVLLDVDRGAPEHDDGARPVWAPVTCCPGMALARLAKRRAHRIRLVARRRARPARRQRRSRARSRPGACRASAASWRSPIPQLSDELKLINLELRAGKPRAEALRNLADRTGVDDLSSLVTMLIQTDKFGTSVAQSLRVYSETLRTKRRQRAEEAAAKTGVKMVFPLVFCIFPAIWVVTIGPAAIRFMTVLFPMIDNMKK